MDLSKETRFIFTGQVQGDFMTLAFGLNIHYLFLLGALFLHTFQIARRGGLLMLVSE
jgi:hypothetical protein